MQRRSLNIQKSKLTLESKGAVLTGSGLIELSVPANVVPEVASRQQVHDQVEILSVLEGIVHVDEEWMVFQLGENPALTHDGLDASLGQNSRLAHLFHREHVRVLRPLVLHLPDFAEAALAYALLVLEEVLADSCQVDKRLFKYYGEKGA